MQVVRLSAIRTGRLYLPRKDSWYSFLLEAESTPGPSATGTIMTMKNSSRTRDVPVCSVVPQPTAPPRTDQSNNIYFSLGYVLQSLKDAFSRLMVSLKRFSSCRRQFHVYKILASIWGKQMTTRLPNSALDTENVTNTVSRSLVVWSLPQKVWQFGWVWSAQCKYQ
jgi:hypothetical protein